MQLVIKLTRAHDECWLSFCLQRDHRVGYSGYMEVVHVRLYFIFMSSHHFISINWHFCINAGKFIAVSCTSSQSLFPCGWIVLIIPFQDAFKKIYMTCKPATNTIILLSSFISQTLTLWFPYSSMECFRRSFELSANLWATLGSSSLTGSLSGWWS